MRKELKDDSFMNTIHLTMTYTDLIKHYGNQTKASAVVGLTQTRAAAWKKAGAVPMPYQCFYELLTKGKLKADRPLKVLDV